MALIMTLVMITRQRAIERHNVIVQFTINDSFGANARHFITDAKNASRCNAFVVGNVFERFNIARPQYDGELDINANDRLVFIVK